MAPAFSEAGRRSWSGAPSASRSRRGSKRARAERTAAWLFLAPDVIGLGVFVGLTMVLSLSMGFFRVSGFGQYTFIGLANYERLFSDAQFLNAVKVTSLYALGVVPAIYVAGLGLALLMQLDMPLRGIMRLMLFAPHVVSIIVVATVWRYMLASRVGVVNKVLADFGLHGQSWLGDPKFALATVVLVTVWFEMGFFMVIFLAGLQEIPRELHESAKIEGASAWQRFWYVTLPLLRPTSFFVVVIGVASAFAGGPGLDLTIAMTAGGPARTTTLATYYVYQQAFEVGDFGYAAAAASVLVAAMMVATIALFLVTRGGRGKNV